MQPRVADISHYEQVDSFQKAADAGLWGIIMKATQGITYVDDHMEKWRQPILDAGLLRGYYHFGTGNDPKAQVEYFVSKAKPTENDLMALDYETNPSGNTMSVHQMVTFLRYFEEQTGSKAVLYSGNFIKENIGKLSQEDQDYVVSHQLWLAQYSSKAVLPKGWDDYFLWQYTGDGYGPEPHNIPGIRIPGGKGIDLNVYDGTKEDFITDWIGEKDSPKLAQFLQSLL